MYYENLIPISPTEDHMELREGSNEDEDFEDCVDEVLAEAAEEDQVVPQDGAVIEASFRLISDVSYDIFTLHLKEYEGQAERQSDDTEDNVGGQGQEQ